MKTKLNKYKGNFRKQIYEDNLVIKDKENKKSIEIIKNFCKFNEAKDYEDDFKTFLSNEDLLTLVYDFYKNTLDKELFSIFNFYFSNIKEHLKFTDDKNNDEYSGYSNGLNIVINSKNNFFTLITLIHELGHIIANLYNLNNLNPNYKWLYTEIESLYFEQLAYTYFNNEEFFQTSKNSYYSICNLAKNQDYKIEICENMEKDNININDKNLFNYLNDTLGFSFEYIDSLYSNSFDFYLPYTNGFTYALFLSNIYQNNKELSLYLYKKILNMYYINEKDYQKYLNLYQIYPLYENNLTKNLKK